MTTEPPRPGSVTPRPSAWRRSPPAPSPRSSVRLLADGAARPALGALRRRPDLGRQVEPDLPRRIRRGRGRPAPAAARAHPPDGPRHGPRAPRPHRARGHGRAGAARAALRRRRRPARRAVLRHGARGRPRLPQRAAGRATRTRRPPARRSAPRSSTCSPTCTRSTRARSASRTSGGPPGSWSASCGGGRSSGRPRRRATCPALDALRDALVAHAARAARRGDRARRLPARQHGPSPDGAGSHPRGARLGDEHARRPVHRPRRTAGVLERAGRRRRSSPRRGSSRR